MADGLVDGNDTEIVVLKKPPDDSRFLTGPGALVKFHDRNDGNSAFRLTVQKAGGGLVPPQEQNQYIRVKDHPTGSFSAFGRSLQHCRDPSGPSKAQMPHPRTLWSAEAWKEWAE